MAATVAAAGGATTEEQISVATRLALLELLTVGQVPSSAAVVAPHNRTAVASTSSLAPHQTILYRAQDAHQRLHESIENFRPVQRFVEEYRINRPYLLPHVQSGSALASLTHEEAAEGGQAGASSSTSAFSTVPSQSIIALLLDAERDLKEVQRDLLACQTFEQRQVAGAGRLAEHTQWLPQLDQLRHTLAKELRQQEETENEAFALMQRYNVHVDTVSQLFLHWDQMLTAMEDTLTRIEKGNNTQQRR